MKGAVQDKSHFVFDLGKGNEKGHAINDDTASLLVYTEKMDFVNGDLPAAL